MYINCNLHVYTLLFTCAPTLLFARAHRVSFTRAHKVSFTCVYRLSVSYTYTQTVCPVHVRIDCLQFITCTPTFRHLHVYINYRQSFKRAHRLSDIHTCTLTVIYRETDRQTERQIGRQRQRETETATFCHLHVSIICTYLLFAHDHHLHVPIIFT